MLSKFTKLSLKAAPQSIVYSLRPSVTNTRQLRPIASQPAPLVGSQEPLDVIFSNDSRSDMYIRNLYKYMTTASVIGVSSALLASSAVPTGLFAAGLALTGVGLDRFGMDYIKKTKTNVYTYKNEEGEILFAEQNSLSRKAAFISSCLGYGCIVGSLASAVPIASSILGISAVTGLFSTLGQLTYIKLAKKEDVKPVQVFLSGVLGGVVGLNLIGSFTSIFMLASPLMMASTQANSYIGILLYNVFTGRRSQQAMDDVQRGKEDHLRHASKFSENWLYSLAPHFMTKLL